MTTVKYNQVKKVEHNGIIFDSKLERDCFLELQLLKKANLIHELEYHPKAIIVTIKGSKVFEYRPDFTFVRDGKVIVMDSKGFMTPTFRLKWKILKALHPDVVFELWTNEDRRRRK